MAASNSLAQRVLQELFPILIEIYPAVKVQQTRKLLNRGNAIAWFAIQDVSSEFQFFEIR